MNTNKIVKGVVGGAVTAPTIKDDYRFNKERRQT